MIHQRELSFKQLRSMKILDKNSCYLCVASPSHSDGADRTAERFDSEFFSQFGAVKSVRTLQGNNDPTEIYVRFADEGSAVRAIAWFNERPSLCVSAKHGFSRYCFKFLNGKKCKNAGCENRHSWADTDEVLSFGDVEWKDHSSQPTTTTKESEIASQTQTSTPEKPISSEIGSLQQQVALQGCIIDDLLREITKLRNYNAVLTRDIAQLQRGFGYAQQRPHSLSHF